MSEESEALDALFPGAGYGQALVDAEATDKPDEEFASLARLLATSLRIAKTRSGTFRALLDRVAARVPETQRVLPRPEIIGPALERLKFLDEGSPLVWMFEELIARAIVAQHANDIHPAFPMILSHLSRDEAFLLDLLNRSAFEITYQQDLNRMLGRFENWRIEMSNISSPALNSLDTLHLCVLHLGALALVAWPIYKQEAIKDVSGTQVGLRSFSRMHLTEFGKRFVEACMPSGGLAKD